MGRSVDLHRAISNEHDDCSLDPAPSSASVHQFSTSRPGIHRKSLSLVTTEQSPRVSAIAAITTSIGPITRPARFRKTASRPNSSDARRSSGQHRRTQLVTPKSQFTDTFSIHPNRPAIRVDVPTGFRMDQRCQNLQRIHNSWTRTGEVSRSIHQINSTRANSSQFTPSGKRL